jgi:two-component system response regulator AgrA
MLKNDKAYKVYSFGDYDEAFLNTVKSDLTSKIYILDIKTKTRSGIEVGRIIRHVDNASIIIYLSMYEEFISTLLKEELMFLTFINKKENIKERLTSAVNKAVKIMETKSSLVFKEKGIIYHILLNDILCIHSVKGKHLIKIKTNEQNYKVHETLNGVAKKLTPNFIKTHRGCYVNKDKLKEIDIKNQMITFLNNEKLPLLSHKYYSSEVLNK